MTTSETFVESEPLPEVAVTTIEYVPAGVPVAGLIVSVDPLLPPQEIKPAAMTSKPARRN